MCPFPALGRNAGNDDGVCLVPEVHSNFDILGVRRWGRKDMDVVSTIEPGVWSKDGGLRLPGVNSDG